jgi:hypothetical protein
MLRCEECSRESVRQGIGVVNFELALTTGSERTS